MSTSFTANEWDSDIDDSNSSEEFMYVKGTPPQVASPNIYKNQKTESKMIVHEDMDENVWNTHQDQIPVAAATGNDFIFIYSKICAQVRDCYS